MLYIILSIIIGIIITFILRLFGFFKYEAPDDCIFYALMLILFWFVLIPILATFKFLLFLTGKE